VYGGSFEPIAVTAGNRELPVPVALYQLTSRFYEYVDALRMAESSSENDWTMRGDAKVHVMTTDKPVRKNARCVLQTGASRNS
jgi:hypothetical protein